MTNPLKSPELWRYARLELSPPRMAATAAGCVVAALAAGLWAHGAAAPLPYLRVVLVGQALVLTVGGAVACLGAIRRDDVFNTFDHERMTRLSAWDLTMGKLLGAPLLSHFAALCLAPAAIAGAVAGQVPLPTLLGTWALLVLGAIATHAFALLLAVRLGRGATPVAILLLVAGAGSIAAPIAGLSLGPLSPVAVAAGIGQPMGKDLFFGLRLHHGLVLALLDVVATGWLLLPVVRNIKRDPQFHEPLTPWQAFGLLLTVSVLGIGFFDFRGRGAAPSHGALLALAAACAWVLGLLLLYGPGLARRRARRLVEPAGWLELIWPAPPLALGIALTGGLAAVLAALLCANKAGFNPWIALFSLVYVGLWLTRDVVFLQWIRLTRIPYPLLAGLLALLGVYALALALLWIVRPPAAVAAMVVPTPVFGLSGDNWTWAWLLPLLVQGAGAAGLALLRHRQLTA